jgi:hypothetical protein
MYFGIWLPVLWSNVLTPFQVDNYLKSHEMRKIIQTNQHLPENSFYEADSLSVS